MEARYIQFSQVVGGEVRKSDYYYELEKPPRAYSGVEWFVEYTCVRLRIRVDCGNGLRAHRKKKGFNADREIDAHNPYFTLESLPPTPHVTDFTSSPS